MKKIFRILYILIFLLIGIFVFTHPVKTETNILRAVFSDNKTDEIIVNLSQKYSSQINVIVESSDSDKVETTTEKFLSSINKNSFENKNPNISEYLKISSEYQKNLLSYQTAEKLKNLKYDEITQEAMMRIFDPLNITLVPFNEDPFMLYTDYIKSFGNENFDELTFNDKYYKIITLKTNPEITNKEIKNLIDLQQTLSNANTRIYLTGTPIHSYYASSKSMLEINIICILSSLFVFGLCLYYLNNLKLLIPIGISLGMGILSGYFAVSLLFSSIHVLTFVFSTTLIGICIDYSLHYFIEKDLSKIFKSLTVSMISTVSAFAVLIFSGVELLKQISVFTMTGLISVYLIVVLFYPLVKFDCSVRKINLKCPNKKIFTVIFILIAFASLFTIKFNDDIRNMYVPSKKLASAEKLFSQISSNNKNTSFAVVEGKDFQDMLNKEEQIAKNIKDADFIALSKFVPSHKQQIENFELKKNLYNNSLKNFEQILTKNDIQKLLNESVPQNFFEYNKDLGLSDFLIDENTSIMILYNFNQPEIIEQNGGKYINITEDISQRIKECREICLKLILPVFVILFLLLSIIYDRKTSLKILAPSIVASTFSVGILSVTGQTINLFHIISLYLIIGFGLDYSVFKTGNHSKEAVLLSCLTSIFSFGLLAFTSFKLISSMGFILAIGLAVSYFTSLIMFENDERIKND